ncbi:uncharacterized protein LOC124262044 [Haliotis rubra]|uniref:uncharacterized protein LOC124262044 n=1 Tax=Haliotis rubra TaxID=36100 RepID=UPI001EE58B2A|nr:uncharacterized protein LOC124262044 [Haliotis rubra]
MSSLLILAAAVVVSVQCTYYGLDKTVCSPVVQKMIAPPPAITTGKLYSVNIDWRELISQRTYNVREYYDDERKLSSLYIQIPPQQNVKVIFDYNTDVALTIHLPDSQNAMGTCSVSRIGTQMYRYNGKPWLTSIMLLYRAMIASKDTQYVANSTVKFIRSYPVSEWSACMYDFSIDITTKTKLFFINDTGQVWMSPQLPPTDPHPVQMMLHSKRHNNTSVQEYQVVGDFVDFTPIPTIPQDAFLTPPGIFCPGRPLIREMPLIADQFYMLMEVIDMDLQEITFIEVWFDGSSRRVRRDTKDSLGTDPNPLSYIYNFETGARYVKDKYLGTCDVEVIRSGDDYTAVTADNHITVKNISEVFHYDNATIQYVGEMTTRGTLCDVWIGVYFDIDSNINATVQWYFTKEGWTQAVGTVLSSNNFYRMDLWRGGSTNPVVYNILKYTPVAQHWSAFDCGECYKYNSKIHFVVQLLAMDSFTQHKVSESYLYDKMQDELTNLIYEEANRMSNLQLEYDGGNYLYVSGLLLDRTPVTNTQVENPVQQHPLDVAYSFFKGTIENRRLVLITNVEGQPIRLMTQKIQQISFPGDFTTVTTQSTPTTQFLIPTLPKNPPVPYPTSQEKTPKPLLTPSLRSASAATHRTEAPPSVKTSTTPPNTPGVCSCPTCSCPSVTCPTRTTTPCPTATTQRPVTASKVVCSCPTCSCPTVTCSTRVTTPCPTVTTQRPVTARAIPGPTQNLQAPPTDTGVSSGALGAAVIASLILGAILCLMVIAVASRYRELPCIGQPHLDTETIPLDNYSTS